MTPIWLVNSEVTGLASKARWRRGLAKVAVDVAEPDEAERVKMSVAVMWNELRLPMSDTL